MKKKMGNGTHFKGMDLEYQKKDIENGSVCLLKVNSIEKPWIINDGKEYGQQCILNKDYKLLQIFQNDKKYVITAFYDDKSRLFEWYIDMVKEVGEENGIPYMMDLYLDLVIKYDGKYFVLDEDELKEALEQKDITENDYKMAYDTMNHLMEKYENNVDKLYNISDKYFKMF